LNEDGSIPEDNPFRERTAGKYRSIYAWGVRNSFGIAVQPLEDGGRMFFTDVGETRFEEVNELRAGANYGWPEFEGPSDDERFVPPLHAYSPSVGRSVCGGMFYPAFPNFGEANLPEKWRGRFFFVDWANHWIKALNPNDPSGAAPFGGGFNAPVAIEVAPDGSLLVLNRGTIWRDGDKFVENSGSLVRIRYSSRHDPAVAGGGDVRATAALGLPNRYWDLPRALSELPLFSWLQAQAQGRGRPAHGLPGRVRSYVLNCPPWLPGVQVKRWWALPANPEAKFGFTAEGLWKMPAGTVLIHHYQTASPDKKPLETRFMVAGQKGNYGAAYRWDEGAEEATLVEDPDYLPLAGEWFWPLAAPELSLPFPGASLSYFPDLCTKQLNRPGADSPIRRWADEGLIEGVPGDVQLARLPALAEHDDGEVLMAKRIRSYLDVNCSICHRPGGNSRGKFDARYETALADTGMILGAPEAGDLGVAGGKVVVPGEPGKSILLKRLADDGLFRMPPVRYHTLSSPIVPLVEEWIRKME
jgi:mono/diheme cytochrome c family protein